jgi:hypothetical protein
MKTHFAFISLVITVLLAGPVSAGGKKKEPMANPDLTKGEPIPQDASHDWNLGATGARGWMFCEKLCTIRARSIAITEVAKGSPSVGLLAVGDVILGVGGKEFSYDPRTEFGKALTIAESKAGGGKLAVTRFRDGKTEEVVIPLPILGNYSATAPFACEKSKRILEQGCEALAKRVSQPSYKENPIIRSLNALALLASGNEKYIPLVRKEAEWASKFTADGMQTWYYGYVIMLLAEYKMATGDDAYVNGMRRLAMEAAEGQSMVGSWGHKFAEPNGRLSGYGMMNAPGVPLTVSLVMARAAGVNDPKLSEAIERSAKLLRFYSDKGCVPYGDHDAWIQTHDDNGKNGMAAVLFNLMDETEKAEYFSRMSVASHGAERDCGHTGNFFNILWSVPGVAQSGPNATGAWMNEFGAWYFDLARQWDGTFQHQGAPEAQGDKYTGWDSTGACLLAYAMPLKKIWLTGKRASKVTQIDAKEAQQLILDGRGWSNADRNSFYDKLTHDDLIKRLGSWSPCVRDRAAMAMARRNDEALPELIKMLESKSLYEQLGACVALAQLGPKAAPAVDGLRKALQADNIWLRIKAADAIGMIGKPAMVALPDLFEKLIKGPSKEDPRAMEQRYISGIVFQKILKKSLDGADTAQLQRAVVAGLQNQDGRSRGALADVYQKMSYEEIKPILPAIVEAIKTPSPSGEMFADGVRVAGIKVLAKHRIKEGVPLCLSFIDINRWNKRSRIKECLDVVGMYGSAAKPLLPELRQLEKDLRVHSEAKGLQEQIDQLHSLIDKIDKSTEVVELRSMQ